VKLKAPVELTFTAYNASPAMVSQTSTLGSDGIGHRDDIKKC